MAVFLTDTYLQPHKMSGGIKLGEPTSLKVSLHFSHMRLLLESKYVFYLQPQVLHLY